MVASRLGSGEHEAIEQVAEQEPSLLQTARSFSVDAQWVRNSNGLRFDAAHYNPNLARAITMLRESGMELRPLGDVTQRVFIPPRFKRVYVASTHGVPFIQGSHVVHFQPADLKHISPTVHKEIEKWLIRENWLLVTRSGTVGRVAITPKSWDGWAASEHLLRIIPRKDDLCPPGYLYAFLQTFAGQTQLTTQIYGAVVDEITEDQARSILVPVAKTKEQEASVARINALAMDALRLRDEAVRASVTTSKKISELIREWPDEEA